MEDVTPERWLPVVDWEGRYEVSDHGRVRSIPGPHKYARREVHIRKLTTGKQGYPQVTLSRDRKNETHMVHRLVAAAFLGPRPAGMEIRHLDDVKTNCKLSNLEYGTRSQNKRDSVQNGIHPNTRKTHCSRRHEFTPENTYRAPGNPKTRSCKKRQIIWREAARQRKLAKRNKIKLESTQ